MVYAASFHRLVVGANLYTDFINFTMSFAKLGVSSWENAPAVTQDLLDDVTDVVKAWWVENAAGVGIQASATLASVKLNRILPNGRYADPVTMEAEVSPALSGGWNTTDSRKPAQLATAVTLRTAAQRGPAARGRFYLPPNQTMSGIATNGLTDAGVTGVVVTSVKGLLDDLNGVYAAATAGDFDDMRLSVASNVGTGRFRAVTDISIGRVVDTIRSRRSELEENYVNATLA